MMVYLNGQFIPQHQAQVSVMDRGFLLGDAVYEVIPFFNGVGFRLEQHLQRLQYSLDAVDIKLDCDWTSVLEQLVSLNEGRHQSVYLQITRGCAAQRNLRYDADMTPTVFAYSRPIQLALGTPVEQVAGLKAVTVEDLRWQRCDIKATGLLANVLALKQADKLGADEAIMVRNGYVTEGASCNLFMVEQGQLYTPLLDQHILSGTTRTLVLELCLQQGIDCIEQPIEQQRLARADEIWITSSTRGVLPVIEFNGDKVGDGRPGPRWFTMARAFQQFEQQYEAQA